MDNLNSTPEVKVDGIDANSSLLVDQKNVGKKKSDWHQSVLRDLEERLQENSEFPCMFGLTAFKRSILKFIFVEDIGKYEIEKLGLAIKEYVDISNNWNGNLTSAYPLIVAFSTKIISSDSISDYHSFGWRVLQLLHEQDESPWPERIAHQPNSENWSMCLSGMPLFINMSCPAHKARKSRNLGNHFTFVINPRDRFDIVAGNNPTGKKIRSKIRSRINIYDNNPHSLQLGSFGSGALEWMQYSLIEKNLVRQDRCPFSQKNEEDSNVINLDKTLRSEKIHD